MAAGSDGLRVFDVRQLQRGQPQAQPPPTFAPQPPAMHVACCAYSADCKLLLAGGEAADGRAAVRLFGEAEHTLPPHAHGEQTW